MRSIAAAPHIFWAILFIILPLLIVVYYAFTDSEGNFSFENITSLSEYAPIFGLSIELAVIATAVCLLIGYPPPGDKAQRAARGTHTQLRTFLPGAAHAHQRA